MARKRTTTPTKPDDVRARRSIQALQDAFLALLEQKPIDQIAIREITDTAGLSHPTFFRRFGSKEELLHHIATGELRKLLDLSQSAIASQTLSSARQMCEYLHARRKLWRTLLTGGAASVMREEFMRSAAEVGARHPRPNPWIPLDLAVPFVTSGFFEILAWWMRQPDDYPIENVITLFNALIVENTARHRDIALG